MNQPQHGMSDDATVQKIMTALRSCYGSLDDPNFRNVYATMDSDQYRQLVEALRSSGAEVTNTIDRNNDVSIQLVLDQAGDQIGLGLSGVPVRGTHPSGRGWTVLLGNAAGQRTDAVGQPGCDHCPACWFPIAGSRHGDE